MQEYSSVAGNIPIPAVLSQIFGNYHLIDIHYRHQNIVTLNNTVLCEIYYVGYNCVKYKLWM